MKKLLLLALLASAVITGCTTSKPASEVFVFRDYRHFTARGIYVTESNSVNFNYEPIGSVIMEKRGVAKREGAGQPWMVIMPTFAELAQSVCNKLDSVGANAIINLRIRKLDVDVERISDLQSDVYGPGWYVTGMAIKK
ncbi:MAG: hypothetical protein LBR34_10125 [Prevotella sp.]|jgi:hypothetical protein|nr:hypothetical protein [Prevotella sp.]